MPEATLLQQTGFLVVLGLMTAAGILIIVSPLPKPLRAVLVGGLLLRIVGMAARLYALYVVYHGIGDATGYFDKGVLVAEEFRDFSLSPLTDTSHWEYGGFLGTNAVIVISGLVLSFLGPTILGEFLLFSLFSFLGLVAFIVAFRRSFPGAPLHRYAAWVLLFPSLWYWPSSVGKESLLLLGLGLATMGFLGSRGRVHWLPFLVGGAILYLVRYQLLAVFLFSAMIAHWLGRGERWTGAKTMQAIGVAALSLVMIMVVLRGSNVGVFDLEGIQEYVEAGSSRELGGGSSIDAPAASLTGVPSALVNVLFRPWPWEASNGPMMFASAEITLLWLFVWFRFRRRFMGSLRGWRSSRILCLACAFVFLYALSLGMFVGNLGVLARQRIFLFPFLFLFLEARVPPRRLVRRRTPAPLAAYPAPRRGAGGIP